MDPTTLFCPNRDRPARGQSGQGNIGIHSPSFSFSVDVLNPHPRARGGASPHPPITHLPPLAYRRPQRHHVQTERIA